MDEETAEAAEKAEKAFVSVEQAAAAKFGEIKASVDERLRQGEESVRNDPMKALLWAGAVGYVLRFVPIFGILRLVAHVLLAAVRPAAGLYLVAKIYDIVREPKAG